MHLPQSGRDLGVVAGHLVGREQTLDDDGSVFVNDPDDFLGIYLIMFDAPHRRVALWKGEPGGSGCGHFGLGDSFGGHGDIGW